MINSNLYFSINLPISPLDFSDEQIHLDFLKNALNDFHQWSIEQFKTGVDINYLVYARSKFIDYFLNRLWLYYQIPNQIPSLFKQNRIALIAVGGYGRGELHPLSDIDILILSDSPLNKNCEEKVGKLVRLLWDLRLDVGHSVRTLKTCLQEAKFDITIMTNLLESRLITGEQLLLEELHKNVFKTKIWPSAEFYRAKVQEQRERHAQYHGTSYNLEPDIKNSPGGLRDIQTIQWIALKHFGQIPLKEMKKFNYLTDEEFEDVKNCCQFLWKIRFALHCVITRYDNRLLFERQLSIANLLGYEGEGNKPIEKMMRDYYRTVHHITELNQMLLQLFKESILTPNHKINVVDIDEHFQLKDRLIDVKEKNLFIQNPTMILKLFQSMLINDQVEGIYSNTIRQLRSARSKLTCLLSDYPEARTCFLEIIKHKDAIKKALIPMHQYGVLSVYIPGWKHIVGMMQFDLFHAYTVDEHTIRLLSEIANFSTEEGQRKHPNSSKVFQKLSRTDFLIIACLFHDIGKGRNSDHSKIGAELVKEFCKQHDISEKESEFISWLVKYHLLMSVTAQNRDLQDPMIIREFAQLVKNKKRLRYLLCLTVADVCATNETLWNSWKQSLMRELYLLTKRSFDLGVEEIPEQEDIAEEQQKEALSILVSQGYDSNAIEELWLDYSMDYFLRYKTEQIVLHAQHLIYHDLTKPLIFINPMPFHGGTEICIYSPDRPYLFATVNNELNKQNLNVLSSLVFTNRKEFALDTFVVLDPTGKLISLDRYQNIIIGLQKELNKNDYKRVEIRRLSSKIHNFSVTTQIQFLPSNSKKQSYMELIALDRPGLLACVGEVFANFGLSLRSAKIATIGERVEDLFILTNKNNEALDDETIDQLTEILISSIDDIKIA